MEQSPASLRELVDQSEPESPSTERTTSIPTDGLTSPGSGESSVPRASSNTTPFEEPKFKDKYAYLEAQEEISRQICEGIVDVNQSATPPPQPEDLDPQADPSAQPQPHQSSPSSREQTLQTLRNMQYTTIERLVETVEVILIPASSWKSPALQLHNVASKRQELVKQHNQITKELLEINTVIESIENDRSIAAVRQNDRITRRLFEINELIESIEWSGDIKAEFSKIKTESSRVTDNESMSNEETPTMPMTSEASTQPTEAVQQVVHETLTTISKPEEGTVSNADPSTSSKSKSTSTPAIPTPTPTVKTFQNVDWPNNKPFQPSISIRTRSTLTPTAPPFRPPPPTSSQPATSTVPRPHLTFQTTTTSLSHTNSAASNATSNATSSYESSFPPLSTSMKTISRRNNSSPYSQFHSHSHSLSQTHPLPQFYSRPQLRTPYTYTPHPSTPRNGLPHQRPATLRPLPLQLVNTPAPQLGPAQKNSIGLVNSVNGDSGWGEIPRQRMPQESVMPPGPRIPQGPRTNVGARSAYPGGITFVYQSPNDASWPFSSSDEPSSSSTSDE